jgi:hypothetical protein
MSSTVSKNGWPKVTGPNVKEYFVTLADALTASPLLYPIALDPVVDAVRLFRLTRREYEAASFLDGRLLTPGAPTADVPWSEVRSAAAGLPVRCHFIFHISHVGSTLLSRLVGRHPALFSLREPSILRFLADVYATLGQPDCRWTESELGDRLGVYLSLWSRTFERDQTAVIKATSFVSEMADQLLTCAPDARAVFMYVAPEVFLRALLGGAMSDVESAAERRLARLRRRLGDVPWGRDDLSPGESVAMSWLVEMTALRAAGDRFPERVLWIDFDRILAAPAEGLVAALRHFGAADADEAARSILAGPTMHRYAKAPAQRFDAGHRAMLLEQAGQQHAGEIAKGLNWLDRAATALGVEGLIGLSVEVG